MNDPARFRNIVRAYKDTGDYDAQERRFWLNMAIGGGVATAGLGLVVLALYFYGAVGLGVMLTAFGLAIAWLAAKFLGGPPS